VKRLLILAACAGFANLGFAAECMSTKSADLVLHLTVSDAGQVTEARLSRLDLGDNGVGLPQPMELQSDGTYLCSAAPKVAFGIVKGSVLHVNFEHTALKTAELDEPGAANPETFYCRQ
jgi:hypothetical protein